VVHPAAIGRPGEQRGRDAAESGRGAGASGTGDGVARARLLEAGDVEGVGSAALCIVIWPVGVSSVTPVLFEVACVTAPPRPAKYPTAGAPFARSQP
jgi:hypothetical protein